nr:GHKL domain-containing protein [Listeria sp. PSOL-1]
MTILLSGIQILGFFLVIQVLTERLFNFKEGLVILSIAMIAIPLFLYMNYLSVVFSFAVFAIAMVWKKQQIIYSLIIISITYVLSIMADTITGIFFYQVCQFPYNGVLTTPSILAFYVVCMVILMFVFVFLTRKIFVKANLELFFRQNNYSLIVLALLILTLSIFYINLHFGLADGFDQRMLRFIEVLFVVYFVVLIGVFYSIIQTAIKELKMKNQQEQLEQLQEYTNTLEVLHNEMRVFRHDYINIISSLAGYIEENDMEALKTYFENNIVSINKTIESNNYKISSLQNIEITELKGLVAIKVIRAQELKIDAIVEVVEKIDHINMKSIDLCKVVGILLDNAVEAALESKNRVIRLACVKKANSVLIVFANSIPEKMPPVYKIFEQGFSTKGERRGLGLSSLRDTLQDYSNVSLDTKLTDSEFVQELEIM